MLIGEGNENLTVKKTTIGLINKKATLQAQHTFFVHFFAVVLHDYNVKLPETSLLHVFWGKCRTCSRPLFFHCRSFSPCIGGRQHFSFCHRRYKIFMLFFQQKMSPLLFSRLASLACRLLSPFLCLSLSLYSKFVGTTINLSLIL